ncbi:MAG: isoquinoline 1-oxidoreductase subunit alpha [Parvibaculum sp.]|uniref:(2Fe-2S)-binding protein n=1 Tax=Parvibaculum sp. TaxID=2024848 RepID=UPI0035BAB158
MSIKLTVNGQPHELDVEPEMPLLWVLRDELGLTGTKFGCGVAACGACTVHIDGVATRTCVTPVEAANGAEITTIEGLAAASGAEEGELSALQAAWIAKQVPQCGYCQSGMLMAVSALLAENPQPTDEDIDAAITNICRCGTYPRIRAAIRDVSAA